MANTIKLKNSGTSTNVPSSLEHGELAINYADGKIFYKDSTNTIVHVKDVAISDAAPSSPVEGDMWFESDTADFHIYYDGAWVDVGGSSVANISIGSSPPTSTPVNGDLWFDSDTAKTYIYYNDGTSSQWIEVGAVSAAASGADGAIQFASGGAFSSDASNLSYDTSTDTLSSANLQVAGENVTPYTGRRNLLYNGAMQVAQRGTSNASANSLAYYTADRWQTAISNVGGWTQSIENDAPTGSGFRKSLKMLCTSSFTPSASDYLFLRQKLEGQDLQHIKKGTSSAEQLTVSFWVKSNVTGTYICEIGDEDNVRISSSAYSIVASGVWEKKTITFPADTSGSIDNDNDGSLSLGFWWAAGSNFSSGTLSAIWGPSVAANRAVGQVNLAAATNNYWQVTGVQLELGDKATPFEHRSYGEELALCQRYYYKPPQHYYSTIAYGNWIDFTAFLRATMPIGVAMRANPSVTYSSYLIYGNSGSSFTGSGTIYTYGQNSGQLVLGFGHAGTGMGAANIGIVVAPSGMEISAEL